MQKSLDLTKTQQEIGDWAHRNFGPTKPFHFDIGPFLGVVEEVGELAHAILKDAQGIRGSHEQHETEVVDAIGDILVYLLDFCHRNGYVAEDILAQVWERVSKRDWTKNKQDGQV